MMRSLTYTSEMASAITDEDVNNIIEKSRLYNESVDVTGMLACFGDRFIQVLEGASDAVETLYSRIKGDPRHRHVTVVQDVSVKDRAYAGYSMRLFKNTELGEAERGIIFQALHASEPQSVMAPKFDATDGLVHDAMDRIMARAMPTRLPVEESQAVSRLLYAAEMMIIRAGAVGGASLESFASNSHVGIGDTRRFFPTVEDLMRTCVLRVLALEHQAFLSRIVTERFVDKAQLAGFITDFIIRNNQRDDVAPEVAKYFALHGGNFTSETAWIVAVAAHEAAPRDGWPFPDLTPTRIGIAIDATDAAARMLASNDVEGLADPAIRRLVHDICLTALEGGRAAAH